MESWVGVLPPQWQFLLLWKKIHEIFLSFGGRLSDFFGVFERDEKDLCSAFTSWMVMVMG